MKKLLLAFILFAFFSKAQTTCNASSFNPITYCYPNQTKSIAASMQTDVIYLCSSNAQVYDTLNPASIKYRQVFVASGSTYTFKSTILNNQVTIWALNGSTVKILAGSSTAPSFVLNKEAGATFINMSSGSVTVNNCTAITGPSVNCTPTSVGTIEADRELSVWPNPAKEKLVINTGKADLKTISIVNQLGAIIYSQKNVSDEKLEVNVENLPVGIYYLVIKSESANQIKKVVIAR